MGDYIGVLFFEQPLLLNWHERGIEGHHLSHSSIQSKLISSKDGAAKAANYAYVEGQEYFLSLGGKSRFRVCTSLL